jgi:hypothetical protein
MAETKQQLIERARRYDEIERASDHGRLGHPGPAAWRKPGPPPATGHAALLRRLRKLCPDLHAKCMAGELTIGRAGAMAFSKPQKDTKPVDNKSTSSLLQEMELWLGPCRIGPTISDEDEARRLWVQNRARFMQLFAHGGRRPMAWWKFEGPIPYPGFHLERSTLWAAGLLGAAEARTLEAHWREEFNRSHAPDFTFGALKGREAHIAALVFHDVPAALAERWAAADVAA